MAREVIVLGDNTSHGGRVITARARMTIDGIPVALWGDHCSCPYCGHDNCVICEGEVEAMYDGVPVALEGHKTSCGATLFPARKGRADSKPLAKMQAMKNNSGNGQAKKTQDDAVEASQDDLEQFFVILDEDGNPASGLSYHIKDGDEKIYESTLGPDGTTKGFPLDQKISSVFWLTRG